MNGTNRIVPGARVSLHFSLSLLDGNEIDSTFQKEPATFIMGDGNIPQGIEELLLGLTSGDRRTLDIQPKDAFGQYNQLNVHRLSRKHFEEEMVLEEGLMIAFSDGANRERPGIIKTFDEESVTVDFNHPLAGKNLKMEVEILKIS